jgi:hypothetical protein
MRGRQMESVIRQHPDLDGEVGRWRAQHPDGTLQDAVADLELWHNPGDADAQRMIWIALRHLGDAAAKRLGFPAMRAECVPAVMDAAPGAPAATAGAMPGCTAGTSQTDGRTT